MARSTGSSLTPGPRPVGAVPGSPSDMSIGSSTSGRAAAACAHQPGGIAGGRVDVAVEHDGQQVRPGPRHHPDQRVAAAAEGEPAAAGDRRAASSRSATVGRRAARRRSAQVGQRVLAVRVRAVLGDQHLRPERPRAAPGTTAWKARSQAASPVPAGSAHVHRRARGRAAAAARPASRCREQRHGVLVQRDRQHPRVVVERGLHPVAVVDVDVDVGDPLGRRASSSRGCASAQSL